MAIDPSYRAKAQEYLTEVRKWMSEINSWSIELMFLQRMLDIYGLKADSDKQTGQVRALKEQMTGFLSEDIEHIRASFAKHEEHLVQIVEDRLLLQDRELPYRHTDAQRTMHLSLGNYHRIQDSAFHLIEELKRS